MQHFSFGVAPVDLLEEPDVVDRLVLVFAVAQDSAARNVECRKQGCCSVPVVVMTLSFWNTRSERQDWLRPLQDLNLGFLIHAKNYGILRRTEVESNNVIELLFEVRIGAELEALDLMRFESAFSQDVVDGRVADSHSLSKRPHTPWVAPPRSPIQTIREISFLRSSDTGEVPGFRLLS